MSRYIDIHTHHPTLRHIEPMAMGIHPWAVEKEMFSSDMFDEAIAIGEIGLDFACDIDRERQVEIFCAQLAEAERRNLPVVLHCVRAFEPVMKLLSEYTLPAVIFHGFVGSPEQAQQAIGKGYYLSFGSLSFRSPKTIRAMRETPLENLFAETDDSQEKIENVYLRIAHEREIEVEDLQIAIEKNYNKIFNTTK